MSFNQALTKSDSYKQYLRDIGTVPSYKLDICFACGLPGVWLYMKSIGLEAEYFDLVNKTKDRSILFKELFYLLIHTNKNNKFFPKVPEGLLKIEIPADVYAAQVEVPAPDFELAFSFTREQLLETLKQIALPNKMLRLGNKQKAVGVMYSDKKYCVYNSDNTHALEYKTLDNCVEAIMRTFGAV